VTIVLAHIFAKNASIHVKKTKTYDDLNSMVLVSSNTQQRKCVLFEIIGRQYSKRYTRCVAMMMMMMMMR